MRTLEPVFAGTAAAVELSVVGQANETVSYQLDADRGTFDVAEGTVVLTDSGAALAVVPWMPPDTCATAILGASSGYETVDPLNRSTLDVPIHTRFGPGTLTSQVGPLSPDLIIAMPIAIDPAGCNLVSIGISAISATNTTGSVGLYDDDGGGPNALITATPWTTPNVATETEIEHAVLVAGLQPGTYWVVVITNGMLSVDAQGTSQGAGPALSAASTTPTLPSVFPAARTVLDANVGFHLTFAPP